VLTCSCLAGPLVGVGRYGWRCSLMECPCAVSLIVVRSFTCSLTGVVVLLTGCYAYYAAG